MANIESRIASFLEKFQKLMDAKKEEGIKYDSPKWHEMARKAFMDADPEARKLLKIGVDELLKRKNI